MENISSLYILQFFNFLIPLITLPYLIRVLGADNYGLVVFSQAIITYFLIITDYGFNLSATKYIARHKEDDKLISEIVHSVYTVKFFLLLVCFIVLLLLIFFVPQVNEHKALYLLLYIQVVASVLSPNWLFQGLEKIKLLVVIMVFSKLPSVPAIFILINDKLDYLIYAGIISGTSLIGGVVAAGVGRRLVAGSFQWVGLKAIKSVIKNGWHIFISNVAVSLYTNSNIIFLGVMANHSAVAFFEAANKVIKATHGLYTPISQSIYPHIAKLRSNLQETPVKFIMRVLLLTVTIMGFIAIVFIAFSENIVLILFGQEFHSAVPVLQIMSVLPLLIGVSNIFGVQTMLTHGLSKEFSQILLLSGLVNIAIIIPLSYFYREIGAAIAVVSTESFVVLAMYYIVKKKRILVREPGN